MSNSVNGYIFSELVELEGIISQLDAKVPEVQRPAVYWHHWRDSNRDTALYCLRCCWSFAGVFPGIFRMPHAVIAYVYRLCYKHPGRPAHVDARDLWAPRRACMGLDGDKKRPIEGIA